jgi:hypothetical protein
VFRDLLSLIAPALDGARALDDAAAIHSMDRWFTFSKFQESARYSAGRLRDAGVSDVEIIQAPADGKSIFADWMMPLAWEAEAATFDVIGQDGGVQRVADRAAVPQCLAMWSAPTPSDGVEAEIAWIADVADPGSYPPEGVRGKIVFTSASPRQAKRIVVERGGIGILSDLPRLSDAVSWENGWSDDPGGWAFHAHDTRTWGFLISPRQGDLLRARLRAGETLRARAMVRTTLSEGTLPTITATIAGGSGEEVLMLGHQFEQGAIDNASGVAIMIEAMRALQRLISDGKLPPPKRTIRCLFVSECYTTFFWTQTNPAARKTIAAVCLDSPAGDPRLMSKPLTIFGNPHANVSYTDSLLGALGQEAMRKLPGYPWRGVGPFGATDNLIADPSIGIPCPWLGAHSRTWHTSADTMDLLDAEQLAVIAEMTAAYAYTVANAGASEAVDFAYLAAARGKAALAAAGAAEIEKAGTDDLDDSMRQMAYLADRQAAAVGSVMKLVGRAERPAIRAQVRGLQNDLRRAGRAEADALARKVGRAKHRPGESSLDPTLSAIHPRRLVPGPLTLDRIPLAERGGRPDPRWSSALFSVLCWCDGKRSLAEACHLAARERRRERTLSPDELVKQIHPNASGMLEYFEFLRKNGYLRW